MYETFFIYSNDILFITDDEGNLLDVNNSFCRILGYNKKQILLTNIKELIHQDDINETLNLMSQLAAGKETVNFQHRYIDLDSNYLTLSCCANIDIETGNIFITAKDVSQDKTAVNQSNPNAEITKLVKDIAHEINNPLGIISGYTELIKSHPGLDTSISDKLDVILKSTERIANTIQNLKQTYCSDEHLDK